MRKSIILRAAIIGFNAIMSILKALIIDLVYTIAVQCFPLYFYNIPKNITFGEIFLVVVLLSIVVNWNPIDLEIHRYQLPEEFEITFENEEEGDE